MIYAIISHNDYGDFMDWWGNSDIGNHHLFGIEKYQEDGAGDVRLGDI
jgi:hypothetical protein